MHPAYSPTGHILYGRGDSRINIWAIPFDLENLRTTGEPFLVISNALQPSVSNDGTLVTLRNVPYLVKDGELAWVTLEGEVDFTLLNIFLLGAGPVEVRATGSAEAVPAS